VTAGPVKPRIGVLHAAVRVLAIGAGVVMLGGCALLAQSTEATLSGGLDPATLAPVSRQSADLRALPPPRQRVTVAVYDLPDLTGQFKEGANFQTLSKAVTQGGASVLIKALQDAGERRWFSVLDRAALDNLLKERQIVTEMRKIYQGEERISASALPPLMHAGILIEGGIVGYDTNVLTGGVGARYLGIGGDTKWIQDLVTVTLRAVSTSTSEVLASVTVHKMIASQSLQGGVFRYVALDRLLEAEAGVTQNEPKQIAVQQAIEKAVIALVIEAAELKVWDFANPNAGASWIAGYRAEKYGNQLTPQAVNPVYPATRNPARVVETRPVAQRPRSEAPVVVNNYPARPGALQQPGAKPPPARPGEVLG
jgi:curli production assembly/transport component CsgG